MTQRKERKEDKLRQTIVPKKTSKSWGWGSICAPSSEWNQLSEQCHHKKEIPFQSLRSLDQKARTKQHPLFRVTGLSREGTKLARSSKWEMKMWPWGMMCMAMLRWPKRDRSWHLERTKEEIWDWNTLRMRDSLSPGSEGQTVITLVLESRVIIEKLGPFGWADGFLLGSRNSETIAGEYLKKGWGK